MDEKTNCTPNRPAAAVTKIRGGTYVPGDGAELHMTDFLTLVVFSLLDELGEDDDGEDD
jgi:hypothetical protein